MEPIHPQVFVTGATGYVGSRLIPRLQAAGCEVAALARKVSINRVPLGCRVVMGDALDHRTYCQAIVPAQTLVHLVGVAHPSPLKARQFESIDLVAVHAMVQAAQQAQVRHIVFVSVAQPPPMPVMRDYVRVRMECERLIAATGIPTTVVRPWYVIGPGHWWPLAVLPAYCLWERTFSWQRGFRALDLVTIRQLVETLAWAVLHPPRGQRILSVEAIRNGGLAGC